MKLHSPVLQSLARLYAESKAGRTGAGQRDFLVDLKKLLADAGCQDGDDRSTAIRQLKELDGSLLFLEGPRRDSEIIHQVRFPPANEAKLFALLETPSPTADAKCWPSNSPRRPGLKCLKTGASPGENSVVIWQRRRREAMPSPHSLGMIWRAMLNY